MKKITIITLLAFFYGVFFIFAADDKIQKELNDELFKYTKGKAYSVLIAGKPVKKKKKDDTKDQGLIYCEDISAWEKAFKKAQKKPGMLLIGDMSGLKGWDEQKAAEFVMKETQIPTGTLSPKMSAMALISFVPGKNESYGIILNMKLAKKLGIIFPAELMERSVFLEEMQK